MLKHIGKVVLVLGGLCASLLFTDTVLATEADYEVKAIPSIKQVDQTKTYFDLQLAPEEQQEIKVKVTNHSDKERTVKTAIKTATTNTNGIVEYINSDKNQSINLPYDLSQLVTTETKEISLAPNESKEVSYLIDMPSETFSGVLSGGLIFTSEDEAQAEKSSADIAINNQFGYVIALILHGKEEVAPNLALADVNLGQINNRNVVFAQLTNSKAAYLNKLNLTAKIKKKNADKPLYETENNGLQMAPNSVFNYPISLQENKFKPGKYLLAIHAESKGKTWNFEKEFEIKSEEAKQLNGQAYIHKDKINYWWYLLIAIVLLLIIFISYIYRKRQQKINALKEQVEELKRK